VIGSLLFPTTTRSYSALAYYAPNAKRPNFLVLTGTYATKVSLSHHATVSMSPSLSSVRVHFSEGSGTTRRAVGVDILKAGRAVMVHVSREVIFLRR
jgi:hypothetical protein